MTPKLTTSAQALEKERCVVACLELRPFRTIRRGAVRRGTTSPIFNSASDGSMSFVNVPQAGVRRTGWSQER